MRQALRARWQRWWQGWLQQRHPPSDTLVLTQRTVYIVPTGAGWLFAALLAVLLLASINYQLNLGYLLTFVLAGIGLASMHTTHAVLRGLHGQLSVGEPVFAGDAVAVAVQLSCGTGRRARCGIGLWFEGHAEPTWADVQPGQPTPLAMAWPAPRRGCHTLPRLRLETRYPYGLFRAWSHWRPAAQALVWPLPEQPAPPLPWPDNGGDDTPASTTARHHGPTEPDGVRPYRRGDALTSVLWKKSAQSLASGGSPITRDRIARAQAELVLHWQATAGLDEEHRCARLAAWLLAADHAGLRWGLALPGLDLPTAQGATHRRAGLDALARWGLPNPTS